jgi:serine/threonine protein kinase
MLAKALSATDFDPAVDFLKRGLRLEPSARATAAQLLEDPWLKD